MHAFVSHCVGTEGPSIPGGPFLSFLTTWGQIWSYTVARHSEHRNLKTTVGRGELMHAFVSYRVGTEGPNGNGLAARIADRIRKLSVEHPSSLLSLQVLEGP